MIYIQTGFGNEIPVEWAVQISGSPGPAIPVRIFQPTFRGPDPGVCRLVSTEAFEEMREAES
jgi:hypothetical protein